MKQEKIKNNVTELVFIIDRSGSMSGLEKDTIGGFNSMIQKQKKQDGKCFVSTVLFNSETHVLHDRTELCYVEDMTENEYCVAGCTALLDALGEAIKHISNIHKYSRREDIPENTLFVITTDGMENASRKYSSADIKKLIECKKEENGWEFIFLGANINAVETAKSYGINEDRAVNYNCDSAGTRLNYEVMSEAICTLRKSEGLGKNWKSKIDADYKNRKI